MSTERRVAWVVISSVGLLLLALIAWVIVDRHTPPSWQTPWGELTEESRDPPAAP